MPVSWKIPTASGVVSPADTELFISRLSAILGSMPHTEDRTPCPVIQENLYLVVDWKPRADADGVMPFCYAHKCDPHRIIETFQSLLAARGYSPLLKPIPPG